MSLTLAQDRPQLAPLRRLPPKALPTVLGEWGEPRPQQPTIELERLYRKQRLAASFRLFGRFGFDFGGAGHITVRDPQYPDHFWLNPAGVHFGHIRVSDLMLVNHDGAVVEHGEVKLLNRAAFAIHSRLHAARPDVLAAQDWLPVTAELEYHQQMRPGCQPRLLTSGTDHEVLIWLVDGEKRLVSARLAR